MTLSARNKCFIAGIAVSGLSLILISAAASVILPAYPQVLIESAGRTTGILQNIIRNIMQPSSYVPFATMAAAVVYSFIGIILINVFFEKTQSPEILFVGFFVISFSFECIRIMVPLMKIIELPNIYLINSSRILIFGRYFGLFSLFAASICTSGLEVQKHHYVVFVSAVAALIIALGIPVDGLSWDSALNMLSDSGSTFILVQLGVMVITAASFFISVYTRGSKEYFFIGLGVLLIYLGRNLLLNSDTWVSPIPGFIILSLGTWFICTRLHRLYLWL